MRRVISTLIGVGFLGVVVWLGFRSAEDVHLVPWFGVASAILAPVGLALLSFSFGSSTDLLGRLAKVPKIKDLMNEADSWEEKVRKLQDQQAALDELVRYETERRWLQRRKEDLEKDGAQILQELEAIDLQLKDLHLKVGQGAVGDQIERLRARIEAIQAGDIILRIGKRDLILPKSSFDIPYGYVAYRLLRSLEALQRRFRQVSTRNTP